jgi:hypothetical protein
MPCTCRTLMRPQQPSFQQRCYPVNAWHHDVGWLWTGRQDGLLANVAPLGEIIVSFPAIGVYNRAWLNGLPHKRHEAFRANIGYASKPDPAEPHRQVDLHGDYYDGLFLGMSAVYAFLQAADIGLIHLHETAEFLATRTNHRTSHLVKPRPCCLIAAKPQDPLKSQRTGPKLLVGYVPHRMEPQTKGLRGPLENRAGSRRGLVLTCCTPKLAPLSGPCFLPAALRASKSITPSQTTKVLNTGLLGRKPLLKLNQCARVIDARYRMANFFLHTASIPLRETSGYPPCAFFCFFDLSSCAFASI